MSAAAWYASAIVYQIDPATFADADGDGMGDLAGVTAHLDHVRDLGATAVWLQPFYRSSFRDGGYDVIDHRSVDPRHGSLGDVDKLLAAAEDRGLRVIVDLIGQHTSIDHPWFQAARSDRGSPYRDYFVWADEPQATYVEPAFPTVEDDVWTWDDEAGQYYRHVFYAHEPDLDLGNPRVRAELWDIVRFWLDRGVSGFRMDALPYMIRTIGGGDESAGIDWLDELRHGIERHCPDAVLLGEADVLPERYADYFGDGDRLHALLDFWINNHFFLALARGSAEPVRRAWAARSAAPDGSHYTVWLRNHDELDLEQLTEAERDEVYGAFAPHEAMRAYGRGIIRRLAPMLEASTPEGAARYIAAHAAMLSLPATPVIRGGDEIGMGDDLEQQDRAVVRTAMQWSGRANAGFSDAPPAEVKVPVVHAGPFDYATLNVERQAVDDESILSRIRALLLARRSVGGLSPGDASMSAISGAASVLAVRHLRPDGDLLLLSNLSSEPTDVVLDGPGVAEEIVADRPYGSSASCRLAGYGYRWVRLTGGP